MLFDLRLSGLLLVAVQGELWSLQRGEPKHTKAHSLCEHNPIVVVTIM